VRFISASFGKRFAVAGILSFSFQSFVPYFKGRNTLYIYILVEIFKNVYLVII
jgi:hypothetical protein